MRILENFLRSAIFSEDITLEMLQRWNTVFVCLPARNSLSYLHLDRERYARFPRVLNSLTKRIAILILHYN